MEFVELALMYRDTGISRKKRFSFMDIASLRENAYIRGKHDCAMPRKEYQEINTCAELTERVQELGILPFLRLLGDGWSAEEMGSEEVQYTTLPDGGWEWPMWKWKGEVIRESGCAYGKFIDGKACFISKEWWPDFCNYRRHRFPLPEEGSLDDMILQTLRENGSLTTRELRAACDFVGKNMRGKFDTYVRRLEMACRVVIEDFVYPVDRHSREYGWGWALLTTPEERFGREACAPDRTPEESRERLACHLRDILPRCDEQLLDFILK